MTEKQIAENLNPQKDLKSFTEHLKDLKDRGPVNAKTAEQIIQSRKPADEMIRDAVAGVVPGGTVLEKDDKNKLNQIIDKGADYIKSYLESDRTENDMNALVQKFRENPHFGSAAIETFPGQEEAFKVKIENIANSEPKTGKLVSIQRS